MAIVWSKMSPCDTSGIDNDDDREEEDLQIMRRLLKERVALMQRDQKTQADMAASKADLAAAKAERVVAEAKLAAAKAENVAVKAKKAAAEAKRFALLVQRVIDENS